MNWSKTAASLFAPAAIATFSLTLGPAAQAGDGCCSSCGSHKASVAASESTGDIVETAATAGKFNTLLAAAEAAGLVEALKGKGPLTVLAPTDEAFAKLPKGTVESLLKPENKDQLKQILLYHVIAANATSDVVAGLEHAQTLQGKKIQIDVYGEKIKLNDSAKVIAADVMATNGVIHVIDTVLLPPAEQTADANADQRTQRDRPDWRPGR